MIYSEKVTVTPSEYHIREARRFAEAMDVSHYLKLAKITEAKAREDCYVGILAEFVVAEIMKPFGCTVPDTSIWQPGKKKFKPDLKLNDGTRIHVKCQISSQGDKYGISWIFKNTDSSVHKNKTGIAALCVMNKDNTITLYKIVEIQYLHDNNLFKPTKLKFKDKSAVYAEDLQ